MLRRASTILPRNLLTLVYTAVIRSQLEYCSAIFHSAAPTHLHKLDIIQKIASRIITNSPPQAHSAPLLLQLGLDALSQRRLSHIQALVKDIMLGKSHPYFENFFQNNDTTNCPGIKLKQLDLKRFSHFGTDVFRDQTEREETILSPFDPTLGGHSDDMITSSTTTSAIINRSNTTEFLTAMDARAGIEVKEDDK